ncbi:MAG: glutaredoxin family protein [Gammaproteobacteria bacterium]
MAKPPQSALLVLALLLLPATTPARTVVECIDGDGNVSFRDRCPPGMTKQGEKQLRGVGGDEAPSIDTIAAANPVTLYVVPQCDACDLVRNALDGYEIPFTVKDVQDDAAAQEELKGRSGGLTVPTTLIGERVLTGYSRDAIDGALRQAGYPVGVQDAAAPAGAAPAAVEAPAASADDAD